jgi:hypothetical protein
MALVLFGLGGFIVFCESGCALVADGAGDMWLLFYALFLVYVCVGCGVMRELGDVLTCGYRYIRVPS